MARRPDRAKTRRADVSRPSLSKEFQAFSKEIPSFFQAFSKDFQTFSLAVLKEIKDLQAKEAELAFLCPCRRAAGSFLAQRRITDKPQTLALLDSTNRGFQKENVARGRAAAGDGRRSAPVY
ncbi:MAG: hypothetical protein ABSC22_16495 [Roseiarcus sp.]|jgi:hypothetical protein